MPESSSLSSLSARISAMEKETAEKDVEISGLRSQLDLLLASNPTPKVYVTTAIHYTNGLPHIGHAYENVTSDILARYHRAVGRDVFFLTGTDEHGQKIATAAEKQQLQPIQLCDKYAAAFEKLTTDLNLSNDFFIRTTSDRHKQLAQLLFQRAIDNDDIYLGSYEGWYNVREETFVTNNEAELMNFKDPTTQVPLEKMKESSYFFRMSKYQDRLLQHYHDNPKFLQPEVRRQEILRRLSEPLLDLSVSRTTFTHGVPLPNDPKHVMYVWFDALSNYLSGIDYPSGKDAHYWPASVHIIGKDIVWFHSVIWPCMLFSIGLELPKHVFAHGFINDVDGKKMSKSIGNVIDPYSMISKFGLDSFRYFLARETKYGQDMPFSEADFLNIHNSELADALGNLVHRAVNISGKYTNGVVPPISSAKISLPFSLQTLRQDTEYSYSVFALQDSCFHVMHAIRELNRFLTEQAPWHLKKKEDDEMRTEIVRLTLEGIYIVAHFLQPFMPTTAELIFSKLNTKPVSIPLLQSDFNNLKAGTAVVVGDILFAKILTEEEELKKANMENKEANKKIVEKKKKVVATNSDYFNLCEFRVGEIIKAHPHPESDKLIVEEIRFGDGEDEVKTILSGLQQYYSAEQLINRRVIALCNLKPAKLAGLKSHGMVICSSNEEKVELLSVPDDTPVGSLLSLNGNPRNGDVASSGQMKKQKIWEKVMPLLKSNENGELTFDGNLVQTTVGGRVTTSLTCAPIS